MTLDDWIERQHINEENAEEVIKGARYSFWGVFGWDVDFECTPQKLRLNTINRDDFAEYTWDEVLRYVKEPKQIKFF